MSRATFAALVAVSIILSAGGAAFAYAEEAAQTTIAARLTDGDKDGAYTIAVESLKALSAGQDRGVMALQLAEMFTA